MGADTSHKQDQMVRRTEPKSQDIYLRLLVKLCRLLARRTGSTFSHIVSKRVFMIRKMKLPGQEEKTAMVVGTVTDE
ncbi:isoform cra_b, partial [Lynx pardinus]